MSYTWDWEISVLLRSLLLLPFRRCGCVTRSSTVPCAAKQMHDGQELRKGARYYTTQLREDGIEGDADASWEKNGLRITILACSGLIEAATWKRALALQWLSARRPY